MAADNDLMYRWENVLGTDQQRAALTITYNEECGPASPDALYRARLLIEAFRGLYMDRNYPNWEIMIRGKDGFCRWMNPTPKP
jgi:hypothetical protein